MAETTSRVKGWLKGLIGGLTGLVSGALVMYLTPLVEKAFKPAPPLANFEKEASGLTVTFHNRAAGASQGWWDYGDGSALEPFSPKQDQVSHTYAGPGDYNVKLSVKNVIGEENDRSVQIHLDGAQNAPVPKIQALTVIPVSPGNYAPATFRVTGNVEQAQICVWDLGDDRPMEIVTNVATAQDRLVTFQRPGRYIIKLAVLNGTRSDEKTELVKVESPPPGAITAILTVTGQATQVRAQQTRGTLAATFPDDFKDKVFPISAPPMSAERGFEITEVQVALPQGPRLAGKTEVAIDPALVGAQGARNLKLQLAPDRRSVRLVGELTRDTKLIGKPSVASVAVPVIITQERREPVTQPPQTMTAILNVPGSTTMPIPPVPAGLLNAQRQFHLELQDAGKVIWQDSQLPRTATFSIRRHAYMLTTATTGDQLQLSLTEAPGNGRVSLNE